MKSTLAVVLNNPSVRVSALAIFFYGFSGAATSPYQSLIGIKELGLSDASYSVLMLGAALVSVTASVLIGILSDRLGEYRTPMVFVTLFGVVGFGMVYALPTVAIFVISKLLVLPVFHALNSLIFANVRAGAGGMTTSEMTSVNSTMRAMISLSWVLVPGLVGFFLVGKQSMLPSFLLASLACIVCLMLFTVFLPKSAPVPGASSSVKPAYLASLAEIGSSRVLLRLVGVALICSTLHVNDAILALVVTGRAGGAITDVGIIVGMVALMEVVFIIFWGWMDRYMSHVVSMAIGAALYAAYLFMLGFATAPWQVYVISVLGGFGAAAIISIPITYLQELITGRPGLGSSLIAVNIFLAGGLSSLLFAVGTRISDYSGTAIIGGAAGLAGALMVLALDRGNNSRLAGWGRQ